MVWDNDMFWSWSFFNFWGFVEDYGDGMARYGDGMARYGAVWRGMDFVSGYGCP